MTVLQVVPIPAVFAVVHNDHGRLENHDGGIKMEGVVWKGRGRDSGQGRGGIEVILFNTL